MGISPEVIMAAAAAASAGVGIYSAMNQPGQPKIAAPPQPGQAPNAQSVRTGMAGMGQGGGSPGIAQTFLSGAGGVNPSMLQLGGNTLLGGGTASPSLPPPPGMG